MALKLIDTVAPCYEYEAYNGSTGGRYLYNPSLITPPRHYIETITAIKQFFYDPLKDVLVSFVTKSYLYWPGWRFGRLVWNAVDGSQNDTYTLGADAGLLFSHWTSDICVGGYDKFYATGAAFLEVKEVDWVKQNWPGWQCYDWAGRSPSVFMHAVVNRADSIVAGISSGPRLYIYNYETHALLGQVIILDHAYNITYESDTHLWAAHATGQLAKINYRTYRHEMLSRVKDPAPTDLSYRCAFDTRRKRLAILRHKPDDTYGACQLQIEFYQPVPQAQLITDPVPVNSLQAANQITFSAHVLGDAGEGIASQAVTAELAAPAAGQLVSGQLTTGQNGGVDLGYLAPEDNAAETLTVATEV